MHFDATDAAYAAVATNHMLAKLDAAGVTDEGTRTDIVKTAVKMAKFAVQMIEDSAQPINAENLRFAALVMSLADTTLRGYADSYETKHDPSEDS